MIFPNLQSRTVLTRGNYQLSINESASPFKGKSGRKAEHSVRMGWRSFRSLRDATRFAPQHVKRSFALANAISNLPLREEIMFPYTQFPSGFNLLVIINYPLSINERNIMWKTYQKF